MSIEGAARAGPMSSWLELAAEQQPSVPKGHSPVSDTGGPVVSPEVPGGSVGVVESGSDGSGSGGSVVVLPVCPWVMPTVGDVTVEGPPVESAMPSVSVSVSVSVPPSAVDVRT